MRKIPPKNNVRRSPTSAKRFRFEFISYKSETVVQASKWSIRVQALLFERDPNIKCYRSYPLFVPFKDAKGIEKEHAPHFEVELIDGSIEIHEVTSTKHRKTQSETLREEAVHRYCQNKGWKYVVHNELTMPDATTAVNLYTLLGYTATAYCETPIRKALLEDMEAHKKVRIREIAAQLAEDFGTSQGSVVATICWMIWYGELNTNMSILLFVEGEINKDAAIWIMGDRHEPETF